MLTGMLNFYFSCVRGNVPVPNIAAETAAMLDDVSHQAEFLSKQASKQASKLHATLVLIFLISVFFCLRSMGRLCRAVISGIMNINSFLEPAKDVLHPRRYFILGKTYSRELLHNC